MSYLGYNGGLTCVARATRAAAYCHSGRCVGAHCSAKRNEAISKTLSLINVVYLPVSKYSISVFKCTDVGGRSVLSAFPNTDCSSAEYAAIFTAGCVGTAVYMVRAALARLACRASSARPCHVRPSGLGPVPQSSRLTPNLNSNGKSFASPVTPAPVQQRMPQRYEAAPHSGSSFACVRNPQVGFPLLVACALLRAKRRGWLTEPDMLQSFGWVRNPPYAAVCCKLRGSGSIG
jgi:hypothetical protein